MINTSEGPKTEDQALGLIKEAYLPAGTLLGIFKQLEGAHAQEAAQYVLANPASYNDKILRLAREKSTGRPIGPKGIKGPDDVRRFLSSCGTSAKIEITVRRDKTLELRDLWRVDNILVDEHTRAGIFAVAMSGAWCGVSRTFTASIYLRNENEIRVSAGFLTRIAEMLELKSTLTERETAMIRPWPLTDSIKATIEANPDLFYDRSVFEAVANERSFISLLEQVGKLNEKSSIEDMLLLLRNPLSREEFLEYYIVEFNKALAS